MDANLVLIIIPILDYNSNGNSIAKNKLLIDVDSELMGLTRNISKDPEKNIKNQKMTMMEIQKQNRITTF